MEEALCPVQSSDFRRGGGFETGLDHLRRGGVKVILSTPDFGKRNFPPECARWIEGWLNIKGVRDAPREGEPGLAEPAALVKRVLVLPRIRSTATSRVEQTAVEDATCVSAYQAYVRALAVSDPSGPVSDCLATPCGKQALWAWASLLR